MVDPDDGAGVESRPPLLEDLLKICRALNERGARYVVVGGMRSPGRARLTGADVPYKWDVQEPYGMSGGATRFRGRGLARFQLAIDLWKPEHFLAWDAFKKLLEPPTLTKPLVVEMGHPVLSDAGIKAVAVEKLGQLTRGDNGLWTSTSDILEYRAPLASLVKPRGSVPATDAGAPVTAKSAEDIELEQKVKAMQDARVRASQ